MKRTLILDLGLFESRCGSIEWSEGIVFNLLRTLAYANLQIMECSRVPPIYASGVRYKKEPADKEIFGSCLRVLEDGHADCEDLAAWRLAELWQAGEEARFVVKKAQLVEKIKDARGKFYRVRQTIMYGSPKNRVDLGDLFFVAPNPGLERMREGGLIYHIQVMRADGTIEDPSKMLGMGREAA